MNYFDILGIDEGATIAEIKKVYRYLVKQYHPDHNPSIEAREKFELIDKAYKILSDPLKREEYEKGISLTLTDRPREFLYDFWRIIKDRNLRQFF